MTTSVQIVVLGLGEAGSTIAGDLVAAAEQVTELGVRSRIAAAAGDQLIDLRDRDTA